MIDLLIAGAGPAGLATALYAERAGLTATVVDPRALGGEHVRPIDKACGEGLMPGAVRDLADLGVDPPGHALRGIGYLSDGHRAEASFKAGPGRGVRRTDLQSTLYHAVRRVGVPVVPLTVTTVSQDENSVTAAGITARYLVAADGLHSPVSRTLGLDRAVRSDGHRWGLRRHFAIEPWSDVVEVHWSDRSEAYLTPVGPQLVGVAVLSSDRGSFDEQLSAFPELAARLAGIEAGPVRGAGPLRRRTIRRTAGRVLLVGDAAGYVDALTGEGIAVSLACARSLVDCVVAGDPADYERRWRRDTRRYRSITSTLLWASQHSALRRAIVPAAQRLPRVFSAAVGQLAR
jgi:flavin-dependent dehydrogenase